MLTQEVHVPNCLFLFVPPPCPQEIKYADGIYLVQKVVGGGIWGHPQRQFISIMYGDEVYYTWYGNFLYYLL